MEGKMKGDENVRKMIKNWEKERGKKIKIMEKIFRRRKKSMVGKKKREREIV